MLASMEEYGAAVPSQPQRRYIANLSEFIGRRVWVGGGDSSAEKDEEK